LSKAEDRFRASKLKRNESHAVAHGQNIDM